MHNNALTRLLILIRLAHLCFFHFLSILRNEFFIPMYACNQHSISLAYGEKWSKAYWVHTSSCADLNKVSVTGAVRMSPHCVCIFKRFLFSSSLLAVCDLALFSYSFFGSTISASFYVSVRLSLFQCRCFEIGLYGTCNFCQWLIGVCMCACLYVAAW